LKVSQSSEKRKLERLANNKEMREWSDHIPLSWKYSAGVAGDRFLQLLKQGKIQASTCKKCSRMFLPPKIYCKECFVETREWREIPGDSGYLYTYTEVVKDRGMEVIALVKFDGVDGGLIGRLQVERPRIGMKVKAVFKPKDQRKGELADIEYFERVEPAPFT